jgi:hypothetical protein
VRGGDLVDAWGDELVLITNTHVLSSKHPGAFRVKDVRLRFEAAGAVAGTVPLDCILWESPFAKYDCAIARLARPVTGVEPLPIAPREPLTHDAAAVLVSPDFLASSYITGKELPSALREHEGRGVKILWLLVRPCLWKLTSIARLQSLQSPVRALGLLEEAQREEAPTTIAEGIVEQLGP